jgi:hypothetical protein
MANADSVASLGRGGKHEFTMASPCTQLGNGDMAELTLTTVQVSPDCVVMIMAFSAPIERGVGAD